MDHLAILNRIAVPRPNYSEVVDQTARTIQEILSSWGVPFAVQEFTLRPYMSPLIGLSCLILAVLFFLCIWKKKPVPALIIALAIPTVLIVEFEMFIPLVSSLIQKTGHNVIVNFTVPNAARELFFCAHYDSKTDFWDHIQRGLIYRWIPVALVLALILPGWLLLVKKFKALDRSLYMAIALISAGALVIFWGLVALGFGGFLFLSKESPGAVDNATAVVTLLNLSKDIREGKVRLGNSNVTILFTGGEEVGLQGADRYVQDRFLGKSGTKTLPAYVVNLELVAQNGNMFYGKKDGIFVKYYTCDTALVERLNKACKTVSGSEMGTLDRLTSDGQRFMVAGIPTVTIGHSGLPGLGFAGFHSENDNMARVNLDNLKRMVKTLETYIEGYEKD